MTTLSTGLPDSINEVSEQGATGATGATGAPGPAMGYGLGSARPSAGTAGRTYFATDTLVLSRDNGATWDALGTLNAIP